MQENAGKQEEEVLEGYTIARRPHILQERELQERHIQEEHGGGGTRRYWQSGSTNWNGYYVTHQGSAGKVNGGRGGNGQNTTGGGAGNPKGTNGNNGTGGLLTIYANNIINLNSIESNGSAGGNNTVGGGGSGGGSINIFYKGTCSRGTITADGGTGGTGNVKGGSGGAGCVSVGRIKDGTYEQYDETHETANNLPGQYVDYEIDLDDDGDTTNDWMIFYKEEDEASSNYGATYLIADYYVPTSKITTSISNTDMHLVSGTTYRVNWLSSSLSYKTITDTVKQIFMYDYTLTSNDNVKAVSRLLDVSAWESDFVASELKSKGGMAIGGPTINMWCASWNKTYPAEKIEATIPTDATGYQVNGADEADISSYTGYSNHAPNVYFPTKNGDSDRTYGYWLASPSITNSNCIICVDYNGKIDSKIYNIDNTAVRPVVYLPPSVTLTQDETTDNLWNINYGE